MSEDPHNEAAWRYPYDYLLRAIHRRLITPESYQYRTMSVVHFLNFQFWIAKTNDLVSPELKIDIPMSPHQEGRCAVTDMVCFGRWKCSKTETMDQEQRRNISFSFEPHPSILDFLLIPTELTLGRLNNGRQLTVGLACGQRQRLASSATNSAIFGVTTHRSKSQFFGSFIEPAPDNKVRVTF